MKNVYYRIVAANFANEPGQRWPVDVLIQTGDPADFASFGAAIEEALDRIQERIDREEDRDDPDAGYLERLEEKLGDSNCEDWDEYCNNISQPEVYRKVRGRHESMNVAEVAGRRRMRTLIGRGVEFKKHQLQVLQLLERQAAAGKKVVKVKRKRLKPRVRPALTFGCVRIDPRLAEEFDGDFIRGVLEIHRRSYEGHDWNPHREGYSSTIGHHRRPGLYVACFTVFLDRENSVTFAALADPSDGPAELDDLMDVASAEFHWDESRAAAPSHAWSPEFN